MVNVPAMTPTDVFKAPRPMTSPANMVDWKVPSSDEKARKSQALGGQKASAAAGKYVDVVVPQAPFAAEKVRYSTMGAPPAPYAFRREQDDAIVPEFKTQQHRPAPNAAVPEPHHAFQLAPPPAAVPDLDFLDMDDWTSPFDLELSFDSIFDSWDEHHLLFNEARMMNQTRHAVVGERSASSEQSNDVASAENQSNGAAQVPSQESSEVSEEVDEFTRNRRLCLQRYREKKRNRKFSKKVRYHLRKMNADRRPRYKGRFIKKGEVIPQELLDAEAAKKAEAAAAAAAK